MTAEGRSPDTPSRVRVRIEGTVQGVGFRPHVYRLARELSLTGFVRNVASAVELEAEGMPEFKSQDELDTYIMKLESDMREAAKRFEFEKAAKLRDAIRELRTKEFLFA